MTSTQKVLPLKFGQFLRISQNINTRNMDMCEKRSKMFPHLYLSYVFVIILFLRDVTGNTQTPPPPKNRDIMKARVESCGGCKVNKFIEVKRFINNDIPLFHNVDIQRIHGANPDLVFLNKYGEIVERIDMLPHTQKQLNQILIRKGFYKKSSIIEEVPEEYREGPYGARTVPKFQIDIDDDQDIYTSTAKDINYAREEL